MQVCLPKLKMSVIRNVLIKSICRRTCSATVTIRSYSNGNNENNYLKSPFADIDIPKVHFTEYIIDKFQQYSNKIAMQCGFTNRKYTYDDILVKARNFNRSLRKKLKLQKGDVVALLLPNVPEFYICVLGPMLAGMKVTTINPMYTPGEIKKQLVDADVKAVITLTQLWNNAKLAVDQTKDNIHIITIRNMTSEATPIGAIDFQELVNDKIDIPDIILSSIDDIMFMPYSSGTTGLPKGVELDSYNIVSNICQVTIPEYKQTLPVTDKHQDVTIAVLPLFHVYGFTTKLALMTDGIKIVTVPKFTPESYINCLNNHKPHILMLVPPLVMFIYSHPGVKSDHHLSSLRSVTCGAAPLGALDEEKLRQKVERPLTVIQGYGLSETSPAVTMVPVKRQGKFPGSMGVAVANTLLKVVDMEDKENKHLPPNKTGELLVKGPQVMKGYRNRPEETKNSFSDGWFRTGDLVRYDDDGNVYIADRIKELIKVKGFQVPPAELEEIIRDFPGVFEAAVIGIPHEHYGEIPRAYVMPKPNSNIDVKKLEQHVHSKVAKHKRLLGGINVVQDIPKTASGKILRKELKRQYDREGL